MKKILRYYFYFSKSERLGVLVLLSLLILFALLPRLYSFFKTNPKVDFTDFDQAVAILESSATSTGNDNVITKFNVEKNNISYFSFDPNTLSKDSFMLLGLSPKQATTILNYRNKGGRFFQKEDLQKIYSINKEQYLKLRPYIDIRSFGKPKARQVNNMKGKKTKKTPAILSLFDPNTASKSELQILGLSPKVVKTIINYRNKGGKFYKKEDLQKIYSLSEGQYQVLEPYVDISKLSYEKKTDSEASPDSLQQKTKKKFNAPKPVYIDINSATPEDWEKLRGIGPAYANRITKFREKLGGFHSIAQISETYGLPDSTFQKVKPFLNNDSSGIQKININTCDAKALAAHPYLKYREANAIIAYRKQHGPFAEVTGLKDIVLVNEELFEKIKAYLVVE